MAVLFTGKGTESLELLLHCNMFVKKVSSAKSSITPNVFLLLHHPPNFTALESTTSLWSGLNSNVA